MALALLLHAMSKGPATAAVVGLAFRPSARQTDAMNGVSKRMSYRAGLSRLSASMAMKYSVNKLKC